MLHFSTMSAYSSTLKPGGMVFSAKKTGTDAKVALLDRGVTVATAGLLYAQFCYFGKPISGYFSVTI